MQTKLKTTCLSLSFALVATLVLADTEPGEEMIAVAMAMGAAPPGVTPASGNESVGPFRYLIVKNAFIIDGTGAPPQGPVTIVVEGDRITSIVGSGMQSAHVEASDPGPGIHVIDAAGKYVIPGMIDSHAHFGSPYHALGGSITAPDYVGMLYLAHGVTTLRDVGSLMGLNWTLQQKRRGNSGEISIPRIEAYAMFPERTPDAEAARQWIRSIKKNGADGVKFLGAAPQVMKAALDEANNLGLRSAYHHAQTSVTRMNALDSAALGLTSIEHWYGLPEAMFEDQVIQNYPPGYNYSNEQDRFSEAGRLWLQAAPPASKTWRRTIDQLLDKDMTMVPTFSVYESNRDVMRHVTLEWHEDYTMPYMARIFEPNPKIHGSYHFDWTTADEVAWKANYRRWMDFVNDYKNAGGRVAAGSDSGFIYNIYGFSYVRELEMLQEAGFHPLEVLQAATLNGAQLLGMEADIGTLEIGKKADMVIVDDNPLANFKVLYGTGHRRFNMESGRMERAAGILYTVKDGIVYDAKLMLKKVREMVAQRKQLEARGATSR
ncbi:amidohydrolase [Kineobactrum sediminis]|uniref:Amidohydrolase n=1 Tax=Kineobactrum sediminis TaxID=1905677 RepID=A0A2N5Y1B8_9GAMM|nr:amidohydrolase [Kineobactrum sediminis]